SICPPLRPSRVASPRETSPTITDGANRGSQRNCEPTCNILHIKWQNQTTGANAGEPSRLQSPRLVCHSCTRPTQKLHRTLHDSARACTLLPVVYCLGTLKGLILLGFFNIGVSIKELVGGRFPNSYGLSARKMSKLQPPALPEADYLLRSAWSKTSPSARRHHQQSAAATYSAP